MHPVRFVAVFTVLGAPWSLAWTPSMQPSKPSMRMTLVSRRGFVKKASVAGGALGASLALGSPRRSSAAISAAVSELPAEAYTTIGGDLKSCRILNGMWQVSGGHGYRAQTQPAIQAMKEYVDAGPSEDLVGAFRREYGKTGPALFYTKWVPRPERISRNQVKEAIGRSLERMDTTQLDLLQFHWWDYSNPYYNDALMYLQELVEDGGIKHLALTNFDTDHMASIYDNGVKIASNQVQYSILDQRPGAKMAKAAEDRGIKLLAYGTVLGGFFSEKWLGQAEPKNFETVSQQKYSQMIRAWGGWKLFQELLTTLDDISNKHQVTIPNVAVRWVIDQPAVGGAIVGVRFGHMQHLADTRAVFGFQLDEEDKERIRLVASKGRNLMDVIGDAGDEYRR